MSHEKIQDCIEACHECLVECENCATACLHEEDLKSLVRCIELNRSCADICGLAQREMARDSTFAARVCELCAEICDPCGSECEKHAMEHCRSCAESCRACADACREMVASVNAGRLGETDRPLRHG